MHHTAHSYCPTSKPSLCLLAKNCFHQCSVGRNHHTCHKGSGNPIAPKILDLIVCLFFPLRGKSFFEKSYFSCFSSSRQDKVQKPAPRMELFSVLFRDQDEKSGESRHKSSCGSVLVVDLLTHPPPLQKFHNILFFFTK